MSIVPSPEIWHRDDFSLLCNWRKLVTAVEIGVDRGEWAQEFLRVWQGWYFLGVDPYAPYPELPWDREADYLMAVTRFERHAKKAKLLRLSSTEFVVTLERMDPVYFCGPFDFVYIDGDHRRECVAADLGNWWPHVSDIGILAGHDFDEGHPGVIQAVTDFARSRDLTVYLTQDSPASWYIYRQGMPGPDWIRNPPPLTPSP